MVGVMKEHSSGDTPGVTRSECKHRHVPQIKGVDCDERAHVADRVLGTADKLMAASILSTGAAAMGLEVEAFLTNWGLAAFRKGDYKENFRISKEYEEYGPMMMQQMQAKKVPSWMENFKGAQEIGDVKI